MCKQQRQVGERIMSSPFRNISFCPSAEGRLKRESSPHLLISVVRTGKRRTAAPEQQQKSECHDLDRGIRLAGPPPGFEPGISAYARYKCCALPLGHKGEMKCGQNFSLWQI